MQFPYRNDWTTKTGSFHPIKFNQYRLNFQDYLQHFTTSYTKIIISVWTRHSCVLNHSFFRNWTFKVKPKFSKQTTQLFNRVYLCVFICIFYIYSATSRFRSVSILFQNVVFMQSISRLQFQSTALDYVFPYDIEIEQVFCIIEMNVSFNNSYWNISLNVLIGIGDISATSHTHTHQLAIH